MLRGRQLDPEQLTSLSEQAGQWPDDWWISQIARHHGIGGQIDEARIHTREVRALAQRVSGFVLEVTAVIAGLALASLAWRLLRHPLPATPVQKASRRLHRVWGPERMLIWFSLAGIGYVVATALSGNLLRQITESFPGEAMTRWWLSAVMSGVAAVGVFVLWPVMIRWGMARAWRGLWHVFDLRLAEIKRPRWWLLGAAVSGLTFSACGLVEMLLRHFKLGADGTAGVSRLMVEWGPAALPFGIIFGVIAAPVCEELLFRGFLFNAFANRFGDVAGAVISSAIFSAGHFYGWTGAVLVFVYGMVFSFIYRRTGRLEANIIAHACVNLLLIPLGWLSWSA